MSAFYQTTEQTIPIITARNGAIVVSALIACVDLTLRLDSVVAESLRANSTDGSRFF